MVSPMKIFIGAVVAAICVAPGEALILDYAKARTAVLNTVERLVKRSEPPPKFIEPRDNLDHLHGVKMVKINEIDPKLAPDRRIHNCQTHDIGWGNRHKWDNYNEHCHYPFIHNSTIEAVGREAIVKRLNEQRGKDVANGAFITRGDIVHSTRELVPGWPESTMEWAANPGQKKIDVDSACKLCTSMDEHYILGKAYIKSDGTHQCNCRKWAHEYEKFMICNCDLCDALMVQNLRKTCQDMVAKNIKEGFLARYVTLDNRNAFFRVYNDRGANGKAIDHLMSDLQKDQSVCRSGVQGKKHEEKVSRPMWEYTDPPPPSCPGRMEQAVKALP